MFDLVVDTQGSETGVSDAAVPAGRGRVLVVADSEVMRQQLTEDVAGLGFRIVGSVSLGAVLVSPRTMEADLALVDLGDLDVARSLQVLRRHLAVPLVTVAGDDDGTAADALDAGAADHLRYPFGAREVAARLRAVCRARSRSSTSMVVSTADFELDFEARRAVKDGEEVNLTPREWALVELLARQEGRLVRHDHLISVVWGPDKADHAEYVRVCLHTLRRKLEPEPSEPRYFITVPRVGVRFDPGGSLHDGAGGVPHLVAGGAR